MWLKSWTLCKGHKGLAAYGRTQLQPKRDIHASQRPQSRDTSSPAPGTIFDLRERVVNPRSAEGTPVPAGDESPFPPCHHVQSSEQGSDGQLMDEDFNTQLISIQQQLHAEGETRNSAHGELSLLCVVCCVSWVAAWVLGS